MKIGIFGGTFNPIHIGHLIIAEYIRINYPLDKIIFIPSGNPPHKEKDVLNNNHRFKMVESALENNPYFHSSDIELNRIGKAYTVDTMRELKKMYPDEELYFIIGSDSLFELHKWKSYQELIRENKFIVYNRSENSKDDIKKEIDNLNKSYEGNIEYIEGPLIEISSTLIRDNIRKNLSIKYLVSEKVEQYIKENYLYMEFDNNESFN